MQNEQLFLKLKKLFHSVDIIQADVPAQIQEVRGLSINPWRISPGGSGEQYRVRCPFCGDTKKHLYISHISYANISMNGVSYGKCGLIGKCFRRNCLSNPQHRAQLDDLIQHTVIQSNVQVKLTVVDDNSSALPKYDVQSAPTIQGIRSWFSDYKPVDQTCDNQQVLQYLTSRGVSIQLAKKFQIGYGRAKSPRTGEYYLNGAPFIMLPIIQPGALKGVQLRCLPKYATDAFPKYLFHHACKRNLMLYNRQSSSNFKVAVLVQGAFDAIKAGQPAMAIFGHTPSRIQLSHIQTDHQQGGVIWLPDRDVKISSTGKVQLDPVKIARDQCAKWNKQGTFAWGAHVVQLPGKDAGQMTTMDIWVAILEQVKNPLMIAYIERFIIPELII